MKFGENDRRLLLLVCLVLLALLAGGSRHSAPERQLTPSQRVAAELGSGVVGVDRAEWQAAARENPLWLIEISQGR